MYSTSMWVRQVFEPHSRRFNLKGHCQKRRGLYNSKRLYFDWSQKILRLTFPFPLDRLTAAKKQM